MKKQIFAGLAGLTVIVTLPFIALAVPGGDTGMLLAKLDAEEARQLKQTGKIMPLEQLIVRVQKDYPGQIIEIELDEDKDRFVYDIEIVGEEGVVIELKLDAATGEVLKYEKDY